MNLQQLAYIIAVDDYRHFVTAAEKSFVTQATLSMMIKKLEEELELTLFDRQQHPVVPTPAGKEVLIQARRILGETTNLFAMVKELKGEFSGEVRIGIIPTLAPYLLPLFIAQFSKTFPLLKIHIQELVTAEIIQQLHAQKLAIGLLATPLPPNDLAHERLFTERFFVYAAKQEKFPANKFVAPKQLHAHQVWLLEEGHCMRNQVLNFCSLKSLTTHASQVTYDAGSLETLINMVDKNGGLTILPELALQHLTGAQLKNIRSFIPPTPQREISLVYMPHYPRRQLLQELKKSIIRHLPFEPVKGRVIAIS